MSVMTSLSMMAHQRGPGRRRRQGRCERVEGGTNCVCVDPYNDESSVAGHKSFVAHRTLPPPHAVHKKPPPSLPLLSFISFPFRVLVLPIPHCTATACISVDRDSCEHTHTRAE
jgi:hypothetical protein